jgi:hypothetical protein
MTYDQIKSYLSGGTGIISPEQQLFSGAASKLVAILLTYPYQLLRSTLQANGCPYNSMTDAAKKVRWQEELNRRRREGREREREGNEGKREEREGGRRTFSNPCFVRL